MDLFQMCLVATADHWCCDRLPYLSMALGSFTTTHAATAHSTHATVHATVHAATAHAATTHATTTHATTTHATLNAPSNVFLFYREREERKKGPIDTAMLRDTKTNTPIQYRLVEEICQLEADLPPLLVLEYQH